MMVIKNVDGPPLVNLFGTVKHQTDDAVMIDFGQDAPTWIPKSCMEDWPDVGDSGDVLVYQWTAIDKGLL